MFNFQLLSQFSRLAIGASSVVNKSVNVRGIYTTGVQQFNVTNQLWAEPMRKKKKMDPAIIKAREERRRKKIEKQIRRLEKNARQLKPIDEVEPPLHLLDQLGKRKRNVVVTPEQEEARALLLKDWTRYKREEYISNVAQVDRIMAAQRRALDMLYEESEDLYNEALMPDLSLIPYTIMGTYATPPIKNYDSPDGEYQDVSKEWGNK
ncbi:39S ribosomal protein L40, mitochondrial [Aricia agestis]|uniref:39S ribosomal protein L40, mitochondrial n=1 Tax=Aricia agestis TaxID=91739 RepID=UPI001C20C122|nr:39S ribosomal protein L40, mitochondrial [Aricia agestis]